MESDLETRVSEALNSAIGRFNWTNDSTLKKTVEKAIIAEIKAKPEYKALGSLVDQQGFNPENLAIDLKLKSLANMSLATFITTAKEISNDLKAMSGISLNAKQAEKKKEPVKPAPVPLVPTSTLQFGVGAELPPELAKIYAEADAKRAGA
jgi:divalent metal cation (Fe/Co/Zn/Cd) transporter